jgi:GT2 family glycosyltransferase
VKRVPEQQPDITVCIVNWNVREDLRRCLDSLACVAEGSSPVSTQIIVVDNASVDGSVEILRHDFPHVQLIANADNRGFARANNQAFEHARGRYVLMLNPDTIVPPGGLAKLVAFGDAHPASGAVGPKLLNTDGSLQHSCRRFPTIAAALFRNTMLGALFPRALAAQVYLMADFDHMHEAEVEWVSGACLMLRREALAQVVGLDEGFFWGSEDVDLCWRLHKAGWKVTYTPEPQVVHAIGRSTDQAVVPTIVRAHRGMYRLYSKHLAHNPFSRGLVWLGVWLRAGLLILSWELRRAWYPRWLALRGRFSRARA